MGNSVRTKYYVLVWDSDLGKYQDVYGPMDFRYAVDTQRNFEFIGCKSVIVQEVVNEYGRKVE